MQIWTKSGLYEKMVAGIVWALLMRKENKKLFTTLFGPVEDVICWKISSFSFGGEEYRNTTK
jgi:hypothetical protein